MFRRRTNVERITDTTDALLAPDLSKEMKLIKIVVIAKIVHVL